MRAPLTVAVAQPLCAPYDVAANAVTHAAVVRAASARMVVFPELSLTGYHLDAPVLDPADVRLAPLVEACGDTGSMALAGAPVAGDREYIGILAIDGAGVRVAYRKLWLGEEEAVRFSPGDAPARLDLDGWRLGLAVCKDTGVVQHAADTAALGIDGYVAGVLDHAVDANVPADRARRIGADHGVWVAMASFAGATGSGYHDAAGRSRIWSADGVVLAEAGPAPGLVVRATLTDAVRTA
jgi:predicted amidohydrolase